MPAEARPRLVRSAHRRQRRRTDRLVLPEGRRALRVAATLAKPELSANAELNLPSETLSQNEMLALFRRYAGARGKAVKERRIAVDDVHRYIKDESLAPKDISQNTQIPVDFYFIVKCNEAQGLFRRNEWDCHWDLFPEVKRTSFEEYLKERFGES